jgi:hypothetical protein
MYRRFAFDAVQGTKNLSNLRVLPAIGDDFAGEGFVHGESVDIDDIIVEESEHENENFLQPINKVEILDKTSKSVHFDQFVYIR